MPQHTHIPQGSYTPLGADMTSRLATEEQAVHAGRTQRKSGSRRGSRGSIAGLITAGAMALVGFSTGAQAASGAVGTSYVGVSVGQSRSAAPCGSLSGCDRRDTSVKLTLGRQLTPHFAAELSQARLGDSHRGGGDTSVQATDLSLVGRVPVDRFTLFGKLGATYGRSDTRTALVSDVPSGKASGWGPSVGVGVAYELSPRTDVVAEWTRQDIHFAGTGRDPVDNTSVGVRWKF